jgi:hypothetical protein
MKRHLKVPCFQVWDVQNGERFWFTHRFLQWIVADAWQRPLFRLASSGGPDLPSNYINNKSACAPYVGCGQLQQIPNYSPVDADAMGRLQSSIAYPGSVPLPTERTSAWTVSEDKQGSGALVTVMVKGTSVPSSQSLMPSVLTCPAGGCLAPPPAPPPPAPVIKSLDLWSNPATWSGTQDHPANPLNTLKPVLISKGNYNYQVVSWQNWTGTIPGFGDNVWVPPWSKVLAMVLSSTRTFNSLSCIPLLNNFCFNIADRSRHQYAYPWQTDCGRHTDNQ